MCAGQPREAPLEGPQLTPLLRAGAALVRLRFRLRVRVRCRGRGRGRVRVRAWVRATVRVRFGIGLGLAGPLSHTAVTPGGAATPRLIDSP